MSAEDERAASPRGNGDDAPRGAGELGREGRLLLAAHFGDSPALCLTTLPTLLDLFPVSRLVPCVLAGWQPRCASDGDTCAGAVLLTAHLIAKLLSSSLIRWSPRLPVTPQQSRSLVWHWVTAPRGCREWLGMGWGGGMMKPGTGDWEWCVITVLVLSPPLWPGALWHGFGSCVKGDTAAWVL